MRSVAFPLFHYVRFHFIALLVCDLLALGVTSASGTESLPPQTKLRVTIASWNTTNGSYQKWDALTGDYEVSADQTVFLPVAGKLSVVGFDTTALSSEVAHVLKEKVGLVQAPEVTISIVSYPPIYIVGDVNTPGEYKYVHGLTVLHSLALGGGELREEKATTSELLSLSAELRSLDDSILRSEIRIARLRAEMAGARTLDFAAVNGASEERAQAILQQENAIFTARISHIERQSKSFDELREFFNEEIANLVSKTKGSEEDILSLREELRRIKPLVEKGLVVPSARNEIERTIRSATGDRLDLATAIMRARQGSAEASRSIEALHDTRLTAVATELQTEQSSLYQSKIKREYAQNELWHMRSMERENPSEASILQFSVCRWVKHQMVEMVASENTVLEPGDVVKVKKSFHQAETVSISVQN